MRTLGPEHFTDTKRLLQNTALFILAFRGGGIYLCYASIMSKQPKGSYRDNLSAALDHAKSLELRLKEANKKISELENPPEESKPVTIPPRRAKRFVMVQRGGYFPLLRLWRDGMRSGSQPQLPRPQDNKYGSVVASVLNTIILVPFLFLFTIVYYLHLYLLVAPWTLLLSSLLSLPIFVLILLRNIRFSDAPPAAPLFHQTQGKEYLWFLLTFAGMPLLLLFIPGYDSQR